MRIGVPKEVKDHEDRVAITPFGVQELVTQGHDVLIERGAAPGPVAGKGWQQALRDDASLRHGLDTHGQLANAPVGEAVGTEAVEPEEILT